MKIKYTFLIIIAVLITNCKPDEHEGKGLKLVNDSSIDVYFYNSEDFTIGHFSDTILPMEKPLGLQSIIANGSSGKYVDPNWNQIYSELPEGKFSVYVFSSEIVDSSPWNEIRANNLVLKRIDLTFEELEDSDYTFTYSE
ncbi:hypothetical protein ACFS5M_09685 [Lacinutrix iliipiscaria]|uniref:Lipoprotein n=1 Tax=Lacinutrix iliipiscaria TaxID=1230532 RepID=A0ABW5WR72_9FLAO